MNGCLRKGWRGPCEDGLSGGWDDCEVDGGGDGGVGERGEHGAVLQGVPLWCPRSHGL